MSVELDSAIKFNTVAAPGPPAASIGEVQLAAALGLITGLADAAGSVEDIVELSDSAGGFLVAAGDVEDTVVLTDLTTGERFRRSDFRHILATVWLDDAIELPTVMD